MPDIDVTDVLHDPMFAEPPKSLQVIRRTSVMGDNGRTTISSVTIAIDGVVTPGSGNGLERDEDKQYMNKRITLHTTFALRGPAPGSFPDIVVWHGDNFIVEELDDLSAFGYTSAQCSSMDPLDQAPSI